jgi:hypothetical protein
LVGFGYADVGVDGQGFLPVFVGSVVVALGM